MRTPRSQPDRRPPRRLRATHGFTLMEVLVALGIFALGMVAIAAIFPAAILLQRETIYEVESKEFTRNTKAVVASTGFESGNWGPAKNNGNLGDGVCQMPQDVIDDWSAFDRCYNVIDYYPARRLFWTPLVYDSNPDPGTEEWRVFTFVTRGSDDYYFNHAAYASANPDDIADGKASSGYFDANHVPAVCRRGIQSGSINNNSFKPDTSASWPPGNPFAELHVGDQIVSQYGVVYTVRSFDYTNPADPSIVVDSAIPTAAGNVFPEPTYYWYVHPGYQGNTPTIRTTSAFVSIVTLVDDDKKQDIVR